MTKAHPGEDVQAMPPDAPPPEEIRQQLARILASPIFHSSRRGQQFIEYVCERALAGDIGALKERQIAVEVFGRRPETDLGDDTIVRVGAREVRKRLAQYYMTTDGAASPIVMELPLGSYVPEFKYKTEKEHVAAIAEPAPGEEIPAAETPAVSPELSSKRRFRAAAAALIAIAALAAAAFGISRMGVSPDPNAAAFQRFWSPVFDAQTPLLIGVGHPIVYQPSARAARLNAQRLPAPPIPTQQKLELAPKEMDGSDIVPVMNQFVGFGDMVAANEVSQMMARHSRTVRVLLASSIPFAELRRSPAYLIGSLSNHWTMELGQNWRFQFNWSAEHKPVIRDTVTKKDWTVNTTDDGSMPEDYSLICRIRNSPTGGLLIVSAGIKQFGTEAAGRVLADPAEMGQILSKLPTGWEEKNLQIVLRTRIIGNTPAQPEVVASHVW